MTEQTPAAAPAAADTPAAPDAPQVEATESAIWAELNDADAAKDADTGLPGDAAFAGEAGEPQGEPEPIAPPVAETPAAQPAAAGIAEKAAAEAAAEAAKLEHRIRSDQGRLEALQKRISAAQAQPSRETAAAREAIAGIKDDYPELAKPLETLAEAVDGARDDATKSAKASLEADQAELKAIVDANTDTLRGAHPDYHDVLKSAGQSFADWVNDQPLRIRQAAARNAQYIADPGAAIEVVTAFKKHLGLIKDESPAPAPQPKLDDRRQRQIAGSAAPPSSGGRPTISGIPEEGDPKAIWNAFEAQEARSARA